MVELLVNGSGFLRVNANEISDDDVYISAAQARRCELVSGDRISGPVRTARRSERHPSLIRIDTINGVPAEQAVVGTRIDDLDADFPTEPFAFAADAGLAALPVFGRGSRVLIAGPPRSGRSALLQRIAAALAPHRQGLDVELLAVEGGVRPEELTEVQADRARHFERAVVRFLVGGAGSPSRSSRPRSVARRIALRGGNAVLLIDTLDGLGHGAARRAMAAARNLGGAGSGTVIAAGRARLGGETHDRDRCSRPASSPSLDESASGTLRAELLEAGGAAKPARDTCAEPRAPRKKAEPAEAERLRASRSAESESPDRDV